MRARAVARPEARERAYPGLLQISLAFSLFAALLGVPGNHRRRLLMLVAAVALGLWIAPTATFTAEVEAGALVPRRRWRAASPCWRPSGGSSTWR